MRPVKNDLFIVLWFAVDTLWITKIWWRYKYCCCTPWVLKKHRNGKETEMYYSIVHRKSEASFRRKKMHLEIQKTRHLKFPAKNLCINMTSFLIENFKAFSEPLTGSGLRKREMRQILLRKLCSTEKCAHIGFGGTYKSCWVWLRLRSVN